MAKVVENEWKIEIKADDLAKPFLLSILVAAPQVGSSTVRKPDGTYVSGEISNCPIGTGADLKGKKLLSNTLVTDFDAASDETKVTFTLNGQQVTYKENVAADKGSIIYKVVINFV